MNDSVHENDLLGMIEGDLPLERTGPVRAALDRDPVLRARVESMTLDRAAMRAMGGERFEAPPGLIADALAEAERAALVEAHPESPTPVVVYRFARYRAVAVAAVGLVAVGAVLLALRPVGGAGQALQPRRVADATESHKDADRHGVPTPLIASEPPAESEPTMVARLEQAEPESSPDTRDRAGDSPSIGTMGVLSDHEGNGPGVGSGAEGPDDPWLDRELLLATHGGLEIRVVARDPEGVVQALTDFGAVSGRETAVLSSDAAAGAARAIVTFSASADEMISLLTAISQVAGERSFFFERARDDHMSLVSGREPRATVAVRIERAPESN